MSLPLGHEHSLGMGSGYGGGPRAYAMRRKNIQIERSQLQPQESQTVALSVHVASGAETKLPRDSNSSFQNTLLLPTVNRILYHPGFPGPGVNMP